MRARSTWVRALGKVLVAAVRFNTDVNLITARWPVTEPLGWSHLPWVILGVLGVGYAIFEANEITSEIVRVSHRGAID